MQLGEHRADLVARIGQLTRALHEHLRDLGCDKSVQDAAMPVTDARARLAYVAALTEQAANRVLNATQSARPLQDRIEAGAAALAEDWRRVLAANASVEDYRSMAGRMLNYLSEVPTLTRATRDHLSEIAVAQDFQELNGQVIQRINAIVHGVEHELLGLLMDCIPVQGREPRPGGTTGWSDDFYSPAWSVHACHSVWSPCMRW